MTSSSSMENLELVLKARAVNLPDILTSYGIHLNKTGNTYMACCIFHEDSTPSMSVYENNIWRVHCHSCGSNEDAIGVIQHLDRCDFKTAVNRLAANGFNRQPDRITPEKPVKAAKWTHVKPPKGFMPDMELKNLGKPSMVWCYRDLVGEPIGYVARYETTKGKTIRPWTYGSMSNNIMPMWESRTFSYPRPLYGMEKLSVMPEAQIMIVEGEKACDAAQKLFPDLCCLTWPGGAQSVKYADWRVLKGRENIVLFPDSDLCGESAMMEVGSYLLGMREEK